MRTKSNPNQQSCSLEGIVTFSMGVIFIALSCFTLGYLKSAFFEVTGKNGTDAYLFREGVVFEFRSNDLKKIEKKSSFPKAEVAWRWELRSD